MSIPLNIPCNAVRGPRFSRRSTSGTCAAGSISIPSRHSNTSRRSTHEDLPMQFQLQANINCQRSSVIVPASAVAAPEAVVEAEVCTSSSSWPSFPKYFQWGEMLGAGSFGKVRVATDTRSKQQYAVKILPKRIEGRGDRTRNIEDEVSIWMRLNDCSNVTHLHAVYQDANSVYLVQELCSGGDLQTLMDAQGILSEHEAAQAALGILATLEQCHNLGICYGDVKPANFLVKDMYPSMAHIIDPSKPKGSLNLKTADFGCSQQCDDEDTPCLTKISGTPIYIAPEVLHGDGYNMSADVWSVGVMLYQMMAGKFPFWDIDTPYIRAIPVEQVFDDIMHAPVLPCDMIREDAADLLARMLDRDVSKRITAEQAMQHPWFQRVLGSAAGAQ